jgi:cytochrome c peroxidase
MSKSITTTSGRIFTFAVGAVLALAFLACSRKEVGEKAKAEAPKGPTPYNLVFPLGLAAESAVIPKDNPLTVEKIKLGKRLYFEKNISADGTLSCASCHIPENGFGDPEQFSTGIGGKKGNRQAPTVINRVFSAAQFWDGRAPSLEEQALGPVMNPVEMGNASMDVVVDKLKRDPSYVKAFQEAFPPDGAISPENVGKAVASFERTILSGNSPYDRFTAGDKAALSEAAQRGMKIFRDEKKGNCETCHASFDFTDENYNNIGVGMAAKEPDLGRYRVTKLEGHQGAFKTPTLREIASTAPYMHDGSEKTLEEVLAFYDKGGHPNKWLSPKIKPLHLTKQEEQDLVEFLKSLSGEVTWYGKGQPD